MHTPRVNWDPPMTRYLAERGVFHDHPLCLVDVGVRGGINRYWEAFGNDLRVIGFDSDVDEVDRLNAIGNPNHCYYPFLVGDKTYRPPEGVPDTQPFARTSAWRAILKTKRQNATQLDRPGSSEGATDMIELDQFLLRDHPMDVDFIKIDTDGSDYQVLRGARQLLSEGHLLGLGVEVQFHGLVHDESNTFRNIDRLLTSLGFSLFDLEAHRYSRAVLPKPFLLHVPAQTQGGQMLWGDALYARDAGYEDYERNWSVKLPAHKLIKLACIFELFGVEDCATELLLKYRTLLDAYVDVSACLDLLTPPRNGKKSYTNYTREFERNPSSFYPQS
jgi:FkbM family methyltransferase